MEYPDCFPEDFEKRILPVKPKDSRNLEVYRIIKSGIINNGAFLSTYEEIVLKLTPMRKNIDFNNPITYSTSCNLSIEETNYILKILMRNPPKAIIAKGKTVVECGPSQVTKERESLREDQHVDWWIYKNTNPEEYFDEVENV